MEHKVLYFPVGQNARIYTFTDENMKSMEKVMIDVEMPYLDNVVVLRSHNKELPFNRMLFSSSGIPLDTVHGDFAIAGIADGKFTGLTERQIQLYSTYHLKPAGIFDTGTKKTIFSYDPIIETPEN